jgi:hypothetical protein
MKALWRLSIVLIAVLFVACSFWFFRSQRVSETGGRQRLAKSKSFAHLPLIQLREQGAVTIGRLESPMVIDGYPCDANWVHFAESGRLKAFYLSDACMIEGNRIPKGTWVQLNPDLTVRFCSFPEDTTIQGILCDGGVGGSEGVMTSFYPSGKLASFFLPKDSVIQGMPCKAGVLRSISLYENGNLKQFTLSGDAVLGGRTLSEGQTVVLGEGGDIQSIVNPSLFARARSWATRLF